MAQQRYITPREYAERLGVATQKVHQWIRSGELLAVNVAQELEQRMPAYKISPAAIEEFERSRAVVAEVSKSGAQSSPPVSEFV